MERGRLYLVLGIAGRMIGKLAWLGAVSLYDGRARGGRFSVLLY